MSILKTLNNMHSYICTLYGKTLVGRYTNRKLLLEFLKKINNKDIMPYSIDECYIKGSKKNLEVTEAYIGKYMVNGFLKIYDPLNNVAYRIWDSKDNTINPNLVL